MSKYSLNIPNQIDFEPFSFAIKITKKKQTKNIIMKNLKF